MLLTMMIGLISTYLRLECVQFFRLLSTIQPMLCRLCTRDKNGNGASLAGCRYISMGHHCYCQLLYGRSVLSDIHVFTFYSTSSRCTKVRKSSFGSWPLPADECNMMDGRSWKSRGDNPVFSHSEPSTSSKKTRCRLCVSKKQLHLHRLRKTLRLFRGMLAR